MLYGGCEANEQTRGSFGVLLQQDFLLPFLSVSETLLFAAQLRLPAGATPLDMQALTQALLLDLGLRDVAHVRVGNHRVRGISGGERRRLSTAMQLVTQPSLLFADEATTGLDAFSARNLVHTFVDLTKQGRTVVVSMHQPRADVFPCFHVTLLLAKGGRVVYFGPTDEMVGWFTGLGHPCPEYMNPGDLFLDLSSVDGRTPAVEKATRAQVDALVNAWSEAHPPCAEQRTSFLLFGGAPHRVRRRASTLTQARVLFSRGCKSARRDVLTISGLLAESLLIAVGIGAIFYDVPDDLGGIVSRISLVYLVGSLQTYQFIVFSTYTLVGELAIFNHETSDGMYTVTPYLLARYAELIPQMMVFPTCFSLIVYYMTGLRSTSEGLGIFILVMFAVHVVGFSLALLAVACMRSFAQASLFSNSLYTFLGLVSGLLVQLNSIPIWLRWLKSVSFLTFSFRILANNEFAGRQWPCPYPPGSPACVQYDGDAVLLRLGVDRGIIYPAVALLINFLVFALAGGAVLAARPHLSARLAAASRASPPPPPPLQSTVSAAAAPPVEAPDVEPAAEELHFRAFTPVTLSTVALALHLPPRRSCPQGLQILQHVDVTFCPGQLTCVMGASGCGKSSLLNVLAARIRPGEGDVSGLVLFNGTQLAPSQVRCACGYVTQHDALLPLLTVRETLLFAAKLRLPPHMSSAAKARRVHVVLAELGLRDCAATPVGLDEAEAALGGSGATRRGISGGEKRRVSVAVQMLTDPAVLLLDEPTSGLDAFTALNIGITLHRLAREEGRTVVASVHQPREGLFALFHQFVLMAQGRLVYVGAGGTAALAYFEQQRLPCPPHSNPADWYIDSACVDFRSQLLERESRNRVAALVGAYQEQATCAQHAGAPAQPPHAGNDDAMQRPMAPLRLTLPLLLRRSGLNLVRQPGVLAARIMQSVAFGVILCCFYTRLGLDDSTSVQNRIGLLYELMALIFVGMLNCIATFPSERNVFYRECADGTYSTTVFILSYTALEVPCELISALVFAVLMCPIAGMQSSPAHFFVLTYTVACVVNAGESIGMAFCAAIFHVGFSVTLLSVFLSFWSVMSGFFSVGMPLWLQVVNHASILKYAGNVLAVSELRGLRFSCATQPCVGPATGRDVLSLYRFHEDEYARDLWVLGLITVLYRLAATMLLDRLKSRHL